MLFAVFAKRMTLRLANSLIVETLKGPSNASATECLEMVLAEVTESASALGELAIPKILLPEGAASAEPARGVLVTPTRFAGTRVPY